MRIVLSVLLLLTCAVCRAAGWTPDLTVNSAFTEGNTDLLVVYTSNGTVYTSGCSANAWTFNADTDARRSRAYATILSALASGKKLRFWYSDTCGPWSYHNATSVMIVN
jgi:hypothetical protein